MYIHDYHYHEYGGEEETDEDAVVVRPDGVAGNAATGKAQSDGDVSGGETYC